MAVLQKIRERSGLLIGVIGFCILAFIAGDLLSGGINLNSRNVGEVNGVSIPTEDFRQKVHNLEQNNRISGSAAYEQVWTNEVRSILFTEQLDKAGLRLGKDQLIRSEEHTSELQSRPHLVCRLLLEKKKYKVKTQK